MLHHKSAQQAQTLDRSGGGGDRRDRGRILWTNKKGRRQARLAEDATLESPVRSDIREGTKKGDTLAVKIEDIQPLIGQGSTRIVSFWYASKYDTDLASKFLGHDAVPHGTRVCPISDGKVQFGDFAP